jgi:acylphosphatase
MTTANGSKRAIITVKGHVQGVSFRAYTQAKARELELKGFVKNLRNGDVLVDVEGGEDDIFQLIHWLQKEGSPASSVEKVLINWQKNLENYDYFRIKR